MSTTVLWVIFGIITIWLSALTYLFYRYISHYNNLTRGISSKTMKSMLDSILQKEEIAEKGIDELKKRCDTIETEGLFFIQKIGLVRFNPFKDTGGDQSFILSLLDGKSSGVVISGLYSRSGTRWYAKKVVNGKSLEHELSEEEKKAVKEATKIKN